MGMMPKEKAKELVREFKKYAYYPKTKNDEIFIKELKENAKQCALIAVNEILNLNDIDGEYSFYLKVKQEIENL